jgi:mRNA-degrading endonuclease RelE of RelBE toxin-antitoxin system
MKKLRFTARAEDDYTHLSPKIKAQADKQLDLLLKNLRYPSLRAKKYDESRDIWQARISRDYRAYFLIEGDTCVILAIKKHPK